MSRQFVVGLFAFALLTASCCVADSAAGSTRRSDACPGGTNATELFEILTYHLKWIGPCYDVAFNRCGEFTAPRCERAVRRYRRQVLDARHDLRRASVPADLERPNRTMHRAIRTALRATRMGLRAIADDDLADWLSAFGLHGRAARQLDLARAQLALAGP
jgi:hypothetical protein